MNEFWKRTLFGAIYVAVVVCSIAWQPYWFSAISCVMATIAVREFHRLMGKRTIYDFICDRSAMILVFAAVLLLNGSRYGLIALLLYLLMILGVLIAELWRKDANPIANWGTELTGQLMIALPFCAMNALVYMDKWLLLALFVLIWINDSGAYCIGSLTAKRKNGNHKMFPRVSPKKSWEGLIGGFVFAVGAAFILNCFGWFDAITANHNGWVANILVVAFALITCIFGTLGDLMESLTKRAVGVKDSGNFLPGHGGALDRFDSILLAAPVVALFCWLCLHISSLC
ncbi:MAG: phosphatidate cytidylyltransferase [Paludibacteraceae bacterium]|nr:phosphatidate cytidylyltransferase [Paludibacteraceae bacterium]